MSIESTYKTLKPFLNDLEKDRINQKKKYRIQQILSILVYFSVVIFVNWYFGRNKLIGVLLFSLGLFASMVYSSKKFHKKIYLEIQNKIVPEIIKQIYPGLVYHSDHHVSYEWFQDSYLFSQSIYNFGGSNYFEGKFNDMSFQFSEIHASTKYGGGSSVSLPGLSSDITVFQGLFLVMETQHYHDAYSVILPDHLERYLKGMANVFQKVLKRKLKLVHFGKGAFENSFKVFSTDEKLTAQLLQPGLQNQLLYLQEKLENNLRITVAGNKVYMAVSDEIGLFDVNLDVRADDIQGIFKDVYIEIINLFEVVHVFNNYQNTINQKFE